MLCSICFFFHYCSNERIKIPINFSRYCLLLENSHRLLTDVTFLFSNHRHVFLALISSFRWALTGCRLCLWKKTLRKMTFHSINVYVLFLLFNSIEVMCVCFYKNSCLTVWNAFSFPKKISSIHSLHAWKVWEKLLEFCVRMSFSWNLIQIKAEGCFFWFRNQCNSFMIAIYFFKSTDSYKLNSIEFQNSKKNEKFSLRIYWGWASGNVRMMSESPGSVIDNVQTRKYLPQAVPNSILLPL